MQHVMKTPKYGIGDHDSITNTLIMGVGGYDYYYTTTYPYRIVGLLMFVLVGIFFLFSHYELKRNRVQW